MLDKVALGQVFPQYFGFPQSVPFHQCSSYLHLHVALTRTNVQCLGTFQTAMVKGKLTRTNVQCLGTFQTAMVKGKLHPRTGHESPEGGVVIDLLFL